MSLVELPRAGGVAAPEATSQQRALARAGQMILEGRVANLVVATLSTEGKIQIDTSGSLVEVLGLLEASKLALAERMKGGR